MITDNPVVDPRLDRLYKLLPEVIRQSDVFAGQSLQALLRILAEQANIVEDDIKRLLENWFVETCEDWVLPYIGELIGYHLVPENALPDPDDSPRGRERTQALIPRREVANTIRFRRRKGALLLLEEIAIAATGWPARATEFRKLVAACWHPRTPRIGRGRTLDLRGSDNLNRGYGPFDGLSKLLDVRRISSTRTHGFGNVSSIGLWVWRLKANEVREGECRFMGMADVDTDHIVKFSVHPAGIDQPLFVRAARPPMQTEPAMECELPGPIRPLAIGRNPELYYGKNRSLQLGWSCGGSSIKWLGQNEIEFVDLPHWEKSLPLGDPLLDAENSEIHAAVDVRRGRILFRTRHDERETIVWARHHVGFSADIGGGGYFRGVLPQPSVNHHWYVRKPNSPDDRPPGAGVFYSLHDALMAWEALLKVQPDPRRVLIQIEDDSIQRLGPIVGNSTFVTQLKADEWLEIRAAQHCRPAIRPARTEDISVWKVKRTGAQGKDKVPTLSGTFILDGVMLTDMTLTVDGPLKEIALRHCTLVAESRGREKALELDHLAGCVSIEKSIIVGSIHVDPKGRPLGCVCETPIPVPPEAFLPVRFHILDSILDGDECDNNVAFTGVKHGGQHYHPSAYADLRLVRSTVFGSIFVHTLELAEDCLFVGRIRVDNTSHGCMRFCSIHAKDARATISPTPPRYDCQPDLALDAIHKNEIRSSDADEAMATLSVTPRFTSIRFGDPGYAQLARDCPPAISRGASDESEMGAFHDLYNSQRESLLRARLSEYTPVGADAQIFWTT